MEDEVLIAMMLESILEDFGCQVVGLVSSIDEALTAVRQHAPDGVLLDMNMDGDDPRALAEELRRRSVPFLLVTGYDGMDSDLPVIKAAPRLTKPFNGKELARRMAEVFGAPWRGQSADIR